MLALQARPPALSARDSASRGPALTATGVAPSANHTPLRVQALRSSVPHDSRTKCERYPATLSSARRALFPRPFAQERKLTPLSPWKRTPLRPSPLLQPVYFHSLADSLSRAENLTPTFPSFSGLFVRSCASVEMATPLISSVCALFVETTREGVHPSKPNPRPANEFRGCYSRSEKKSEALSEHP